MFFSPEVTAQLISGTAAGLGQAFGQRLVLWVVKTWHWVRGQGPESELLIREVALATVRRTGIPRGYRLLVKREDFFVETTVAQLTSEDRAQATVWLFPDGHVWQATRFTANGIVGQAEIGVEFAPESGFHCVVPTGAEFDHGWLSSLLQGVILGIVNSLPQPSRTGLLSANPESVSMVSRMLDESLRPHGIRCRGIRNVTGEISTRQTPYGSDDAELQELAVDLEQITSEKDWSQVVDSLKAAGVPVGMATAERLDAIRDSVLTRQVSAPEGVRRIAELTTDAFRQAGIEQRDLRNLQVLSESLADLQDEDAAPVSAPASVSVASFKKPSTWFVWNREEVDRRQLLFTKRMVKNCRFACEQALTTQSDIPAVRQIRELKEQITLIEDLLATVPPLNPPRAAMRVDKQVAKDLVAAYADAVRTAGELGAGTDRLLNLAPSDPAWTRQYQGCFGAASKLTQMVRDRRTVR